MSIYTNGQPTAIHQFRETTAKNAGKMENVGQFTFVCKCCGKNKPCAGRERLVKETAKFGFKCAGCASK